MNQNIFQFPEVTNREDWSQIVGINDAETGLAVDLTGLTFQCEVRRMPPRVQGSGYGAFYDIGTVNWDAPVLTAALGSGLTVIDIGKLQISFPESKMRALDPGTYAVALTATDGTATRQIFLGRLPVLFGGVTN